MNKKTVGVVAGVIIAGGIMAWLLTGEPSSTGRATQEGTQVGLLGQATEATSESRTIAGQGGATQASGRALKSGDLLPSLAQPDAPPAAAFVPEAPKALSAMSFVKELVENIPLWHHCNHVVRDIAYLVKQDAGEKVGERPHSGESIPQEFLEQFNGDLKVIFTQDPAASAAYKREIGMVLTFQLEGVHLPEPVRMAYEACLTHELSRTRFEMPSSDSQANLTYTYRLTNGQLNPELPALY